MPAIKEPKKEKKANSNHKQVTEEVQLPQAEPMRPIIYPVVRAEICQGTNAITEDFAKQALGWEIEREFVSQKLLQHPGSDKKLYEYGDVYMLKDEEGNKVRCLNNLDNRPYDEAWAKGLAQTILRFQWAGALTLSDMIQGTYGHKDHPDLVPKVEVDGQEYKSGDPISVTAGGINGSSVVISRTGRMESGQHSLTAEVLACQMYRAGERSVFRDGKMVKPGTYPEWDQLIQSGLIMSDGRPITGPVIETILVTGISEDRRVLMTVDNCKPRTEADVFYTSDLFVSLRDKPGKRKEMSRMLQACVDLFWKRTDTKGYKTHSEVMALVERHPRLLKCVEHLFEENGDAKRVDGQLVGGRLISNLKLSAGQCSALCYIMGCSASDGDAYRNSANGPPREKGLDWSRFTEAKEFFAKIGTNKGFEALRQALGKLVDGDPDSETNPGLGGRFVERMALLAKAWKTYSTERTEFTMLDLQEGGCLCLHYSSPKSTMVDVDVDGQKVQQEKWTPAELLENSPDFGGIDVPEEQRKAGGTAVKLSKDELLKAGEDARKRRAEETAEKIRQMRLGQDGKAVPRAPVGPATTEPAKLKGGVG